MTRQLPAQDWMESPEWERSQCHLSPQASYVRLHENLLDLTHLSFLHAKSFGTPDYAKAAFETEIGDDHFALLHQAVPTTLPPVWGVPTDLTGPGQAARIVHGRDFALNDPGTTGFMHDQLFVAFQEDVDALALQELALAHTPPEDLYEFSVAADAPAMAMRRHVLMRHQKEAAT